MFIKCLKSLFLVPISLPSLNHFVIIPPPAPPPLLFELVNMRFPGGGIFSISIHISVNKQQRIEETGGRKVFEKSLKILSFMKIKFLPATIFFVANPF